MALKMYILAKKANIGWTWDSLETYFFQSKKLLKSQMRDFFKGKEDVMEKINKKIKKNGKNKVVQEER